MRAHESRGALDVSVLSPKSVSIGVAGITPGLARDVPLALRGGVLVERLNFTKVTYILVGMLKNTAILVVKALTSVDFS